MNKILGAVAGLALMFGASSLASAHDVAMMTVPVVQESQKVVVVPVAGHSHGHSHYWNYSHHVESHHTHGVLCHLFGSREHW
ncbi:MAG: hypothetical protein HQL84_09670 [Magnetococcales bacterium]|nr:hypothetical protein [Magnetococcales bacterium]MBF0150299.1 hypothetical protein [Magnetococcales bacterium]MBF0173206.1 hypothetical protein [Magnetococcales bacterium]MBF0347095.1 hypothetical protein [Magnetococcales bacterium]MBF0629576.1 hypothetical protein [Magnetococcales bacterium]